MKYQFKSIIFHSYYLPIVVKWPTQDIYHYIDRVKSKPSQKRVQTVVFEDIALTNTTIITRTVNE